MAVPATELRPRGAVALFDAAIRLAARSSGAWALTLPAGAAVTWAVLQLAQALARQQPLLLPALWFTLAWLVRCLCLAATCHHLDAHLVGERPTSALQSLRAALARLPSIVITAAWLPLFNLLSLTVTVGLGYFLLASHLAAWAVVMKGKGHPLGLYGTCARTLGPARSNTPVLRILFFVVVLVALNVHLAANVLLYLGRKLLGLDLIFAQRFTSLDNGTWVAVVIALTFVLFEPLRAAVATLLVVDGRVRQEGLDLMAAVEQLPRRNTGAAEGRRRGAAVALAALVTLLGALLPGDAAAQQPGAGSPLQRLRAAGAACGVGPDRFDGLEGLERLGPAEQAAMRRLADDVELFAVTWQDCEEAEARLEQALPLLARTLQVGPRDGRTPQERAKAILARPEFEAHERRPAAAEAAPPERDESSLWARFIKWLVELLEGLFKDEPRAPRSTPAFGGGLGAANALVVILLAAVVVLIAVLLYFAFRNRSPTSEDVEVEQAALAAAAADPDNALSRPPEGWASLADELAAQGRFREAVRSLYLALLSRLHRAGAIDYDPALSNWDYCRRFRGRREWLPTFRDLTLRFDFAWYGLAEVEPNGYAAFRTLTEPMLRPDPSDRAPALGAARG